MNEPLDTQSGDLGGDDVKALEKLSAAYDSVRKELGKVIVVQSLRIDQQSPCQALSEPNHTQH